MLETERVLRERMYEHRIVSHQVSQRSASINHPKDEEERPTNSQQGSRRSSRSKKRVDYKTMNSGENQLLTEGSTEFSAHVASEAHEKEDLKFEVICTDENWFQRGVKEAIAIRKLNPTLNQDEGRYHLSAMYSKFIRSSLAMNKSGQDLQEANHTE